MTILLDNVKASLLARNIEEMEGFEQLDLKPHHIKFLLIFEPDNSPMSEEQICEKTDYPPDVVSFVMGKMESSNLVTQTSPEWIMTPQGIQVFNKCNEILPEITEAVDNDPYFKQFSKASII